MNLALLQLAAMVSKKTHALTLPGRTLLLLCSCVLPMLTACQFAPKAPQWPSHWFGEEKEKPIPDRMLVIWTDTVLHQPQLPGVRGFGGRVFFYQGKETTPIEVDGGLAIYAFDANALASAGNKPERKFVFTADQMAEHMSKSDMGPSYSIWVPWDEVGGMVRQLSLIARFEGRSGGVVISDPTIKLLPGLKPSLAQPPHTPTTSNVELAAYTDSAQTPPPSATSKSLSEKGSDPHRHGQKTSEIDLPPKGQTPFRIGSKPARQPSTIELPPSFSRYVHDLSPSPQSTTAEKDSQSLADPKTQSTPQNVAPESVPVPPSTPQASSQRTSRTSISFRSAGDYRKTRTPGIRQQPLRAGWMEPPKKDSPETAPNPPT